MTSIARSDSAKRFIDRERGLIRRDIFTDPDIYRQELEQVFTRAWLFVGHESQIPNPDDYFISRMGEESVILTRDRQGKIHVLLNTCTHRGMKVVRYDEGNTRTFSCPYHGWSFSTDGQLVSVPGELLGVPQYRAAYHEQLDKREWGLIEVAQLANYKGTIWATWDKDAPPFEEYLGGMKLYLDAVVDARDGREGRSEVLVGVWKWRFPANWKFAAENFLGDHYHAISHRSEVIVGTGPGGPGTERHGVAHAGARRGRTGNVAFPREGHGSGGGPPFLGGTNYFPRFPNNPAVAEYFKQVEAERHARLDNELRAPAATGNIFPNLSFHGWFPRGFAVWHPVSATVTEAWRWYLVDADAPQEVKDLLRHYYLAYGGPAGMTEQDDMENWNYAGEASNGVIARRRPYNYAMGMGWEEPVDTLDHALFTAGTSEQNPREFYWRWAEYMDARSWDDLRHRD